MQVVDELCWSLVVSRDPDPLGTYEVSSQSLWLSVDVLTSVDSAPCSTPDLGSFTLQLSARVHRATLRIVQLSRNTRTHSLSAPLVGGRQSLR